ncbi:serine hydrolase [Flavobacteriaceae bacterium R38]|nr:serine hydrolase [Flavobacteriaceae bacterium R38]
MKYLFTNLLIICILFTSCSINSDQKQIQKNNPAQQLDSLITYSHNNGMFNGSIAILKNDTLVFNQSYGYVNKNSKNKINAETIFYIASISKQFTAMGIMMLQEKGLLDYDDSIDKYLPELTSINKNITIRNLLQHTSGISDRMYYQIKDPDNQDVVDKLKTLEDSSIGNPNKQFSYSNTGYVLLALIIEKVSGTTIGDFFQKEIFNPLDMRRTTTSKEKFATDNNRAYPYNILGLASTYNSSVIGPAGIYSSVNDLIKWNSGIRHNKLISSKTMELAFTNGTIEGKEISYKLGNDEFGYGFGWSPFVKNNDNYVRHDGSTEGYRSLIQKNLSKNIDVILLTNHGGALAMDEITYGIDQILENQIYVKPNIPLPNKIINKLHQEDIHTVVKMLKETLNQDNKPDERVLGRLGYTMQNNGKIQEAIELYKINLELYPESTNCLYVLGEVYVSEKQYELAKNIYDRFLKITPNSKYVIEKLKLIDNEMGKNN